MTVELNCNKYRVKRYKGEGISIYYYKGTLVDELPKHHDVLGIFQDESYGIIGVVDKVPKFVNIILSLMMMCITAVMLAISVCTILDGNKFEVYVAELSVDYAKSLETVRELESYEYSFEFNRCARLVDNVLQLNAVSAEDCRMTIMCAGIVLTEDYVSANETYNPAIDVDSETVKLVISYDNATYTNIIKITKRDVDRQRTYVIATPEEIVCTLSYPNGKSVRQYAYYKDNRYVEAEVIQIQDAQCVHIVSNCDISKSYWDDDYHTPVVIGYTDISSYNMILGNGNKKNVPENVRIINNMFSLGTVDACSSNYFTYEELNGYIEIYVPLDYLSSEYLPIGDNAIIVPSDSDITVQINSNLVQCGNDNIHAVLLK